jgi:hypothetical protein
LLERNRSTASTYKSLDEKINSVATKVVHLGDQLESINTPRSEASLSYSLGMTIGPSMGVCKL